MGINFIQLPAIFTLIVSTSVSIQRVSPLTDLLSNNMYSIQCTINTQPNTIDANITSTSSDVTTICMNNVYVSSMIVSAVLGDDLMATCNWDVDGEIFTNTTTAQGIMNDILLLVIYSLAANAPTSLTVSIIDSTSINVSWTAPVGGANGYIVAYNDNTQQVSSTHTILSGLSPTVYNITVHGYKDVPSVGSDTVSILLLNGEYNIVL